MLRITVLNDSRTTRIKMEGKLAHEWVREAEKAWKALMALNGAKRLIVDLFDVSFVDDPGMQLLAVMHHAGARLQGSGPLISALIEEIREAEIAGQQKSQVENALEIREEREGLER